MNTRELPLRSEESILRRYAHRKRTPGGAAKEHAKGIGGKGNIKSVKEGHRCSNF